MNQTANYQLSQWEASDRILMSDFNADNAKIDAALEVQAEAITGLNAAIRDQSADLNTLRNRVGAQLLATGAAPVGEDSFIIPMSGVTWSQWKTVYIVVELTAQEGMGSYSLYVNDDDELTLGETQSNMEGLDLPQRWFCAVLTPLFSGARQAVGLSLGSQAEEKIFALECEFNDIEIVAVRFESGNGHHFSSGTYKVWGEK